MYRLLDYSQTNRYLKIQNTFSTKKHPIYYTYDPQTYQTYITKIIQTKDPKVIQYYKHHINTQILPYLKMKRLHPHASILSLPVEDAEVIIKIDQEQRIKKQSMINNKIEEIATILKTYHQYNKNSAFEGQINQIQQFLKRLSINQADIQYKIQQITDSISTLSQIFVSINQITIASSTVREKIQSLSLTHQEQQKEQQFEMAIQWVDKFKSKQQGTLNQQNLKPHQLLQIQKQLQIISKYLSNTAYLLKSIKQAQPSTSNNQVEELCQKMIKYQQQLQAQHESVYQSNVMFITKKFIKGKSLREMIISKDSRLTPQFCLDLTKAIVDFIFMNGGVKDLFITTQNIIVEDCGTFHLNYFSFVGLDFIKLDKYIPKSDFQEILPYLHYNFLKKQNPLEEFDVRILFRFIIINFVSAFFKRDFIFNAKQIDFEIQVRNESSLRDQVEKIEKKLLGKSLTKEEKGTLVRQFDIVFKVQYEYLVQGLFKRQQSPSNWLSTLSWEIIFSKLSRYEDESNCRLNQQKYQPKGSLLNISHNLKCLNYPAQQNMDLFYLVDISIFQAFDHYIHLLNQFKNSQQFSKLSKGNQDLISKKAPQLQYQRKRFTDRDWYYKQIYIPVKMQMTYTQILNYSNWVHMLHSQKEPNIQTVKGVQSLLAFLLQVQEILKITEPFLTESILLKSIKKGISIYCTETKKGRFGTYYNILTEHADLVQSAQDKKESKKNREEQNQSDGQQDRFMLESSDQEDEEMQSLKSMFWKCFFSTVIVVYNLIKKYYIRVNQVSINGEITINGQKYIKILQQFKPEIPPLTINT